jgi:undecaprenyl-diphosphatase
VGIALVAWAGEASGVAIGKALVGRPRPPERIWLTLAHGSSWPSGHTAVAVVVFGTLALATSQIVGRRSVRVLAWALAALVSVAVAYSRVELGVHWCTDTIASLLFVTGWLAMVVVVLRRVAPATLPRPGSTTPEAGPVTTSPSASRSGSGGTEADPV